MCRISEAREGCNGAFEPLNTDCYAEDIIEFRPLIHQDLKIHGPVLTKNVQLHPIVGYASALVDGLGFRIITNI